MDNKQPAIFFGHGNPMNAIGQNDWTKAWEEIGRTGPPPRAVLCISAHWYVPATAVTAMAEPRTIHDFGGFPRELFEKQYPAPGLPELAARTIDLLGDTALPDVRHWGLDHGTWAVFCHVFPEANVPIVQLSLNETLSATQHYELAKKLRPLRREGIMIAGSGNVVHNLHTYAWGRRGSEPFDWALRFEGRVKDLIASREHERLARYEELGRDAMLSVPTPEHYLPLLYVLAQQEEDDESDVPVSGFDGGSISMLSVRIRSRK